MSHRILFRVEGGGSVGFGHLVRSIAIASRIRDSRPGAEITFISNDNRALAGKAAQAGIPVVAIPDGTDEIGFLQNFLARNPAGLLFIDTNKEYGRRQIEDLEKFTRVFLFNVLSEGAFESSATVIPSAHADSKILELFGNLNNFHAGPEWIVPGQKALELAQKDIGIKRGTVGITTGASDPKNVMTRLLGMMQDERLANFTITGYTGEDFMHRGELDEFMKANEYENIKTEPFDMEALAASEVVIATFGVSTYELLHLGKAVISVGHAPKNAAGSKFLADKYGAIIDLGLADELDKERLTGSLTGIMDDKERIAQLGNIGRELVDGKGADRVAGLILEKI